ncbi:hypothetical protein [Cognatiyoonia sp. IB215182]|uniref:calcium-binding protein n=1 Tax=Cognatiyoonia sp. IB215182 TaxID=3097353 RepID=UPI002A105C57|nr:hypothetical protein [Cognatiyoonia sp. IB215182]MDX8355599.1 hypothetical protein [Cognatiyoonia sp. IB215182]
MTEISTGPLIATTLNNSIGTLGTEMFGVTAQNMFGTNEWMIDVAEMGLQDGRFTGGTVAEEGWVVDGRIRQRVEEIDLDVLDGDRSNIAFDLTHPELISPIALQYDEENHLRRDDVQTFSQMLERAVESGTNISLVIPVKRYFLNQDLTDPEAMARATATAEADISFFLNRLKNEEFNNGEYPEKFIFEIGNELYSNPIEYALISKIIIDKITEDMADSDISYQLAFQMGRGSFEFNNLLEDGYFDLFFENGEAKIPELNQLDFIPGVGLPYEVRQIAIDKMMTEILDESLAYVGGNRHHVLSFSRNDLDNPNAPLSQRQMIVDHWREAYAELGINWDEEIDYYYSAFSTNTSNGNSMPFEMAGATNLLDVYAFMLEEGVDRAAIWGVTTEFRYRDGMSTTTITDRLSEFDSPQKALLTLMTENVMGGEFLGRGGGDDEGYRSFLYETDDRFTVFYYVDSAGRDGTTIDVDLGILSDVDSVSVVNLDMAVEGQNGASLLTESEQAVVDGSVQISFDQDFEVVMVNINKLDSANYATTAMIEDIIAVETVFDGNALPVSGTGAADQIFGEAGSDIIFGGAGDDVLDGGAGRAGLSLMGGSTRDFTAAGGNNSDFIFGGEGDDVLRGNAGNDLLSGDEGDDELWGGSGFDTFVFSQGSDSIGDYQIGIDKILISVELVESQELLNAIVASNTSVGESSLTIDFGGSNELTIEGVTDVRELSGSLTISDYELMGG